MTRTGADTVDLLSLSVDEFLTRLAATGPIPAGGAAAAVTTAMSAALVAMVGRASTAWPEANGIVAQAEAVRARVAPLAAEDSEAYAHVLEVLREAGSPPDERDARLGEALLRAADLPLAIADAAADAGVLAAEAAVHCSAAVRGDALAAALLAEAAARSAAELVAINLALQPDDARIARARALVDSATMAAARALAAVA